MTRSNGDDVVSNETRCQAQTEVFSRAVGFYRPISEFNRGLKDQYTQRKLYNMAKAEQSQPELTPLNNGRDDIMYDGWPKP